MLMGGTLVQPRPPKHEALQTDLLQLLLLLEDGQIERSSTEGKSSELLVWHIGEYVAVMVPNSSSHFSETDPADENIWMTNVVASGL